MHRLRMKHFIPLCLILLTVIVYWPVLNHQFINYDDPAYVTENHHVRMGLTYESIRWAFTTTLMGNWNPITWLSHMLDYQIYGLNPKGHHLTNLVFHVLSVLLLFTLLTKLTGALWRSALVAAIFALHPLRIESVAWVSERKDVLSTFFFMLTLSAYVYYVKKPTGKSYFAVILLFILGLMSKPMLVTLPFVLLLLDAWPLQRLNLAGWPLSPPPANQQDRPAGPIPSNVRVFLDKVPLLILAAAFSALAIYAQRIEKAVLSVPEHSFYGRISNALLSYVNYLSKTFWPKDLAVLYPLPESVPPVQAMVSLAFLAGITFLFLRLRRHHPHLLVGWLWFVGTLMPVIGLVQVGLQAMADRYTYIPSVGIYILVVWAVAEIAGKWRCHALPAGLAGAIVVSSLSISTRLQLPHWQDSIALFTHAIRVTNNNYIAHTNLGDALDKQGRHRDAIFHYAEALRIKPREAFLYYKMACALDTLGRTDIAFQYYGKSLQIDPSNPHVHNNFGIALIRYGRAHDAKKHFLEALRLNPDLGDAHYNLGLALASEGEREEAILHYYEALRLNPWDSEIRMTLQDALAETAKHRLRLNP
jgi:protein O-mannosyl-transferase